MHEQQQEDTRTTLASRSTSSIFFNNIMLDKAKTREADGVVDVFVVDTVVHHILVNFWRGAQSLSLTHRYSRFLSAQCGIV